PRYGGRKGGKANRQAGPIASFHVSFQGNVHVLPVLAWLANFLAVPRPTAKNLFLLMTWSFAEGSGKRAPRKRGGVGFGCECRVADSAERDGGEGGHRRCRTADAIKSATLSSCHLYFLTCGTRFSERATRAEINVSGLIKQAPESENLRLGRRAAGVLRGEEARREPAADSGSEGDGLVAQGGGVPCEARLCRLRRPGQDSKRR
ncbi:hypothetical protein BHM03_00026923, partial [Ensete ventricosum]